MRNIKLLLVLFWLVFTQVSFGQFSQIRFEKLDTRDGLSHNRVTSIYKDQLGFMWFGTRSGLNRYDGNSIKVIEHEDDNSFSLSDQNIVWIKEGPEGYLWIKSDYGVFAYDIYKESYVDIRPLLAELDINHYNLSVMVKDGLGNFWFVIDNIGVKKYLSDTKEIYHYGGAYRDVSSVQPDNKGNMALVHLDGEIELADVSDLRNSSFMRYPEHIANIQGLTVFIDKDGDYWFYSSAYSFGVCYYRPSVGTCIHLDNKELGSNLVTGIIQDESERIIIGADHGGVTMISKTDWKLQSFSNNPSDPRSLSHNSIIALYQDRTGLVWIGTNKGGVNYFSPKSVSFNFYKQTDNQTPNANDIWPLVEDDEGNLWIGTDGGGLVHFDLRKGEFTNYRHKENDPKSISSDIVVSMAPGANGGLWLGTYFGGLNYFDGKKFKAYYHNPEDSNSISDNSIWNLLLDSRGLIWVGTLKGGVDVYDADFNKIHHFGLDNQGIHSNYVTSLCEDKDGNIWIGTGYGIEAYNYTDGTMTHLLKEEGNDRSLVNNSILDIYCDHENSIWVGTMYGLSRFNRATNDFDSFVKEDGLPENIVTSVMEDLDGNIWLGTYTGLSKLHFENEAPIFENFDISDGLQGDMFNERSALRLKNGHLAFGGKNGLNVFDPEAIKVTNEENKLVFLDFYLSNRLIKPGDEYNGRKWFERGINNVEKLVLEPSENSFTLEFTSLNFYQQENTVYKYRLVGFDQDWIQRANVHRANYTNLDPGNYRFEVMASDRTHQWSDEPIAIDIVILTPFWKTPLANLIYVLFVLLVLFLTRRAIIQKERFRAKVTQDQMEATRLHELDMMKIKFFTNISHEFRTPLTLILTPIERMLKKSTDPQDQKHFQLIFRNAKRLLTLVNQLLDFRKMEANQHRISLATGDVIDFTNSIVESFSDLSADRRVRLDFESNLSEFLTLFDRDKMEKIMFNLLSNAFKFTHTGGRVVVKVSDIAYREDIHTIRFSVTDDGIGIPKERQGDIFNRFFQVDNKHTANLNHGSGIGLSITKEFVEMHGGNIWVESEMEKGSSFIFELPMKKLSGDYKVQDVVDDFMEESVPLPHEASKATILLADDNDDFRFYLKDNLERLYNIYEAPNGKAAWKKILNFQPDLVVSDIMMPEINGIELCKKIKGDPRTGHIPVILLTAHYSDDQKLEGFEAGAIEYITKPFNFEILVQSIRSAVQLQKLIFASEHRIEAKPREIEITSLDEQFIMKAMELVEVNISNSDFSVQELSRELAVSRGQLYKKTLELTGKTPIEFIRSIRIKRAAALLERSQLNVAEVAYKVGFNNPKYFTKYFKMEYKMLPSKYAAQATAQKGEK